MAVEITRKYLTPAQVRLAAGKSGRVRIYVATKPVDIRKMDKDEVTETRNS